MFKALRIENTYIKQLLNEVEHDRYRELSHILAPDIVFVPLKTFKMAETRFEHCMPFNMFESFRRK